MKKIKQWLKSKTIWWNTIGMPLVITLATLASQNITLIKDNLGSLYGVVAFILIMVPNYLRTITTKSIGDK